MSIVPVYAQGESALHNQKAGSIVDIDMGDYQTEMYVGNTQLLMITILPTNAIEQTITYQSSNSNIASINMLGRITALAIGTSVISVSAGEITRKFTLTVTNTPSTDDAAVSPVAVSDIEIENFKDTIKIDETVELSATVLPKTATNQELKYTSSNPKIATIASSGQLKGLTAGVTTITVEADGFKKSLKLTVKAATQSIHLNKDHVVLKTGQAFELSVNILPNTADQHVTYQSTSNDVVSVSETGIMKALKQGVASIIISTWDASKIISVLVRDKENGNTDENDDKNQQVNAQLDQKLDALLKTIIQTPDNEEIIADGGQYDVVNSMILKELYGTEKRLTIQYPDYSITIYGKDIKNISNELDTKISMLNGVQGLDILINNEYNLPGKIYIQLFSSQKYSHLYLFNANKNTYQELNTLKENNRFSIDNNGKYILTQQQIQNSFISWLIIIILSIVTIGLIIVYIVVKKRHWFW